MQNNFLAPLPGHRPKNLSPPMVSGKKVSPLTLHPPSRANILDTPLIKLTLFSYNWQSWLVTRSHHHIVLISLSLKRNTSSHGCHQIISFKLKCITACTESHNRIYARSQTFAILRSWDKIYAFKCEGACDNYNNYKLSHPLTYAFKFSYTFRLNQKYTFEASYISFKLPMTIINLTSNQKRTVRYTHVRPDVRI